MKVLLINGYQNHPDSRGNLNKALFSIYLHKLMSSGFEVKISSVEDYYLTDELNEILEPLS